MCEHDHIKGVELHKEEGRVCEHAHIKGVELHKEGRVCEYAHMGWSFMRRGECGSHM